MLKKTNKIGILTLNGYNNYGNRLQNYALEETIRVIGFEVETIIVDRSNKAKLSKRLNKISSIKKLADKIYKKLSLYYNKKNIIKRREKFIDFSKTYIHESDYALSIDSMPDNFSDSYNYFVTGSDQVWNPNNLHGTTFYFLTFAEKCKRIAYAPSFGVSEIKPEFVENYKEWISEMHKISVREDDGAKIIKELAGRDAPVLVDPTILLTKEKWLSISKEANNKPKGKYLLTYFLGGIPDNYKKQIKNIVTENKLEVINLGDIREKETYRTGPSEFIDYINDCSIFCTDSFHGAVFSILLEKPFIVFERIGSASMYSRIDTLLNKFELNDRKVENMSWGEDVFDVDFSHIPPILAAERKKSMDYLKDAFNIKDE